MWNYETDTLCIDPVSVDIEVSIAVKVVLCRAVLDLLDLDDGGGASARTDWLENLEFTHWRVTGWVCAFLLLGFFRPIRQLIRFYCGVIRDLPAFGWWSQLPLMALVFSSHLQPHGPDGLAAVRFSCPVRVCRLRIFPIGAPLFENALHMRSVTSPDAFYLDVFFNAQSVRGDGKDRQRPANALMRTSISYAGGLMDFAVDMGSEYATRLVIVKGSFEWLSLAIYGHIVGESPPMHEPRSIVPFEPEPLALHLDPAHASDPTALAKSLLELIPNAPSLSLAIRLVFCLKPTLDDWDIPGFPHIYASLDNDTEDYDLDSIIANLDRPIPEGLTQDTLDRFVERLTDFVGSPVCLLASCLS